MKRVHLLVGSFLAAALILTAAGCSNVISRAARAQVTPNLTFSQVRADPAAYIGKHLLLGGQIVRTRIGKKGSELEVFRYRLDHWGEPIAAGRGGGRFLVHTERFLDPVLYSPGRLITLVGTVIGQARRPLGPITYTYPVFRLGENYVWATPFRRALYWPNIYAPFYVGPENAPRGNPYDPGLYAYPYSPYWLRPPGSN